MVVKDYTTKEGTEVTFSMQAFSVSAAGVEWLRSWTLSRLPGFV